MLRREIECLRPMTTCCLVGDGTIRITPAAPSKLCSGGLFSYPDGPWFYTTTPTQARSTDTDFLQLFLSPVESTMLCDHSCICRSSFCRPCRCPACVQFGQFCCRNGLRTSLGLQHRLSTGLCVAAAAQGSLQGCANSPGEQLSKPVKCFIVKPGVQLSSLSHISAMNQTSPVLMDAGSSWSPQGTGD